MVSFSSTLACATVKVKMFHSDGEGGSDRSAEKRARNQVGTYVQVFGNVSPTESSLPMPPRGLRLVVRQKNSHSAPSRFVTRLHGFPWNFVCIAEKFVLILHH